MKSFFVLLTITLLYFLLAPLSYAQKNPHGITYEAVITRVIDGDTVDIEAKWLLPPLKPELSIRVFGVDTPEKGFRAKCNKEADLGSKATEYTKKLVEEAKDKKIVLIGWDKYGGRVLGDVILDGKSLRYNLIKLGYAREYYGEAKKSWCG
jgi:endonuclease YncB( thermonuclease family)